jgi:hypothetical protein
MLRSFVDFVNLDFASFRSISEDRKKGTGSISQPVVTWFFEIVH